MVVDDDGVREIHSDDDDKTLISVPEGVPTPIGIAKLEELSGVESQDIQVIDEINDQSKDDEPLQPSVRVGKNRPPADIIGEVHDKIKTMGRPRQIYRDMVHLTCYTSYFEPKNVEKNTIAQVEKEANLMPLDFEIVITRGLSIASSPA